MLGGKTLSKKEDFLLVERSLLFCSSNSGSTVFQTTDRWLWSVVFDRWFPHCFSFPGNPECLNVYCSSNSSFKYDRKFFTDVNNAAAEAIKLSHEYGPAYLDEYINSNLFLTDTSLEQLIHRCEQTSNWSLLATVIEKVFSDRQNLSSCFLQKGFLINISLQHETGSTSSATSKSNH